MSKVAIKGNASGTGTFTVEAPNSNTDRTLVLPDEAGTVLTSASDIPAANLTGDVASARITNALNATGSAPIYACRAWATFDGTFYNAASITASGNVSSVTDNGTGDYTISYTTALSDADYAITCGVQEDLTSASNTSNRVVGPRRSTSSITTTSLRLGCANFGYSATDAHRIYVAIFR